MTEYVAGFYCGAAFLTYVLVEGSYFNRIVSAVIWPTFPLWRWFRI